VKRALILTAVVVAVSAAAVLVVQIEREHQYRELLSSGEQALRDGNGYLAIELFSGALALRPDSVVAYYRRGEAYRALRHFDEAISDWTDARRLAPDAPEPLVALGELYDQRNQPAMAAERYADAADLLKDEDPGLLYALGLARYRAGSTAAALAPLQLAVARNDTMAEAHYLLGLVYQDVGDTDRAIASLERAIDIMPRLTAAREELVGLYRVTGRTADEFLQLQSLALLEPQTDRQIAIALAQARRGDFAIALSTLRDAGAVASADSRVDLAIGRVYLMQAERTRDPAAARQARVALEAALGGTARRSEGLALLGRAEYLAGEYETAERVLKEAVATTPADLQAFDFLADAAERLAHYLVARDALLNLDLLEANTVPADRRTARLRRLGALSLAGGDHEAAVRFLSRAVDAGRSDASTLALYAGALWESNRRQDAEAILARAESADPEHADVLRWAAIIRTPLNRDGSGERPPGR